MLKRLRPAPQGRGYRVRKRSNHVIIILDTIANRKPTSKKAKAEAEAATKSEA